MIFYDHTEARERSPIQDDLKQIASPLKNLEAMTKADIAVLPGEDALSGCLNHPKSENIGRLLNRLSASEASEIEGVPLVLVKKTLEFWKVAQRGCLIQRKSGSDLIASVPRLAEILEAMWVWTNQPWLLITGEFVEQKGKVVVNGRKTDFDWPAYIGALYAWQRRGGYIQTLPRDDQIKDWLLFLQRKINTDTKDKVVYFRQPSQKIVGPDDDDAWVATLMTFPNIGSKLALKIGEMAGNLAFALSFLSMPNGHTLPNKPEGYGKVTNVRARKRLGLADDQVLLVVPVEKEKQNG